MRHHPGDVGLTTRAMTQECTQIGQNGPSVSFWGICVHCCAVGLGCGWPWDRNSVHKWEDRASPRRIGAFVYTVGLLRAAVGTQECTQTGENKAFGWFSYGLCTLSSRWAHRAGVRRSEQPLSPLCDDRDGHAALQGAPAPPVPCHVATGEVGGSVLALELAVPVRASENAATLIPGRLRGAMARPERLRRAVGRGRGGRPLPRRTRQDERARAGAVHGHAADARGGRAHLGQARTPLARLAGRPREEVGSVGAHGGGARPGAWVR